MANLSENDFVNNIIRPEDGTNMCNYTQEYQYDEIGNLTEMKSNGVWTRDYKYNFDINSGDNNYLFNHDHNSSTADYLYDTHGNMTKMPHLQELFWDYTDNLKEVTLDASNNKAYYVYDANGDRVRKVVVKNSGTIVEDRFYIGDYEIYSKKTNGTLDTERETLHINDDKSKVALIDYDTQTLTSTVRFQYTNHLDSASLELDETGDIISYEEYHPFGTTSYRSGRNEIDVSLKRYKYVHKELDNETGLYYYGMRYYASWIARFISVDPLQLKFPHLTPFQYASNDPIGAIDLDGAESTKELIDVEDQPGEIIVIKEGSWFANRVKEEQEDNPARALHIARVATWIDVDPKNAWERKIYGDEGGFAAESHYNEDKYGTWVYEGSVSKENLIKYFPIEPLENPYEGYLRLGMQFAEMSYKDIMNQVKSTSLKGTQLYLEESGKIQDQMFTAGMVLQGGLGLAAMRVPVFSWRGAAVKGGISAIVNFALFGKDADVADIGTDMFLTPGWSAYTGGAFDYAPFSDNTKFRSVFHNKSLSEFSIDFGTGLAFDNLLNFKLGAVNSNLVNGFERSLFNTVYTTPFYFGKYGTVKALKERNKK